MTKIPQTKPNWTVGRFSLYVNDEPQGYFRQFRSAWTWREYLKTTGLPNGTMIRIYDRGSAVSIVRVGDEPVDDLRT